jgi:hypothetical protein
METFLDRPGSDTAPAVPQPLGAAASSPLDAAVSPPLEAAVPSPPDAVSQPLGAAVSGHLAVAVLGTTAVVAGLLWDISWHASIGRDTFWTPAHLAIYLGGLLCGLSAGWLALSTTFAGTAAQRGMAVGFWGFRAPLGAWVAIWGSIAMLTSAPFDNWWHDAYGLDVKIISPPHLLLAAGVLATQLGAMLQALAAQNRQGGPLGRGGESAPPPREKFGEAGSRLAWTYAYAGGLLLALVSTMFLEYNEPNKQHGALFYEICCAAYPLVLVGVARGARLRWPATTVAGIFMAVRLAMTWLLPLFPATPKLAPIYNPVRHLWPPFFPELLIVPAVALDLLLRRAGRPGGALAPPDDAGRPGRRAALALALGTAFFALLLAAQWSFSELLLSPYARNWFFAADQWTYRAHPGAWRYRYWLEGDAFGPRAAALSLLLAAASSRLGLAWGGWLSRVRR